ncbi:MAG: citrate synthase family protein [Myxococcota bacterium]
MANVDQRSELLTAKQAAALLGVKLATLYAYTSRGLVRSTPGERGRARRYARSDLEQLKARHDARSGHGPVAASALRWGEPVLESALTTMDTRGPIYRGHVASALAERGVSFESVAELLWTGQLPAATSWRADRAEFPVARVRALLGEASHPFTTLSLVVPALAAQDPARYVSTTEAELARARTLVLRMAASLVPGLDPARVGVALSAGSVARTVAVALGAKQGDDVERAINTALILCADHELNPSSFTARIAASSGADLYACVSAALATLSGPLHGGACDRVEALVAETQRPARAADVIHERTRRGEAVPGFGHRLYKHGDPRTPPLLEAARALGHRRGPLQTLLALVDAMRQTGHEAPTVDVGLVALCLALGLPPGSAAALFAVGRSAGWIAHVLEQRTAGFILRPRARYIGPTP